MRSAKRGAEGILDIRTKLKKLLIWTFAALFFGSGFLALLNPVQKAKAATYSFSSPGKWYMDGNTGDLVNEIQMTKDGTSSTIKWHYKTIDSAGVYTTGSGLPGDEIREDVSRFALYAPGDLISSDNSQKYWAFVQNPKSGDARKPYVFEVGIATNDPYNIDFNWKEKGLGAGIPFQKAHGGADSELGQYLAQTVPTIESNKPAVNSIAPTGITDEAKNACKDFLILPSSQMPDDPINAFFKKINDQVGQTVIDPVSSTDDLSLYHSYFKSSDALDFSDRYIDQTDSPAYTEFVGTFNLETENGLIWFWRDKGETTQKNMMYTVIGAAVMVKFGQWWALAPASVAAVATMSVDYYKGAANHEQWQKMAKLLAAKIYLTNHMEYDRCIAQQSSTSQNFKDRVAKEEINFNGLMKLIAQEVADYKEAQAEADKGDCGSWTTFVTQGMVAGALTNTFCAILTIIADVGKWLIDIFGIASVINAYHPPPTEHLTQMFFLSPSIAHAAASSSIKDALNGTPPADWVLSTWKLVLGLADVFVVLILLFIAITNILHIQYDTYAIKKTLPTLIIGIILANFSIFITKMLVDATNVLTATFTGGDPGQLLATLITSTTSVSAKTSLGGLFITVLFGIFSIIVFIIIGFLFYIRYAVILVLTIAAPLAFVAMAFPPTQGFFKQWSSWYFKFIFMKPISVFLIYLAGMALSLGAGNSITGWAMAVFLLCAAIIVPFKLGGAVMAGWGKTGKWLASPVTNAAKNRYNRFKQDAGTFAMNRLPLVGRMVGSTANKEEASKINRETALARQKRLSDERSKGRYTRAGMEKEAEETLGKTHAARWGVAINKEEGGKYTLIRKEAEDAEIAAKTQEADLKEQMRRGTFNTLSAKTLKKYANVNTALELKTKYAQSDDLLDKAERKLKKRMETDLSDSGMKTLELHNNLMANIEGKTVAIAADGRKLDYDDAQTERSSLLRDYAIETDGQKKQEIANNLENIEKDIIGFENQQVQMNPKINFNHYLDKNAAGRMQARLNPAIAEDMDAILKSENIEQITGTLENGGGSGESRFTAQHVKDYLAGNIQAVPITSRAGIQAYLMAYQTKVSSSGGIDQLEAVSNGVKVFDKMSPGAKAQLFQSVKAGMSAQNIADVQQEAGKTIDELTYEDIIKFDISRPNSRSRDFVRRLAVAIRQHPALGAAGSPGKYVGRGESSTLTEDLMSKNAKDLAKKALGGAISLTGTTPQRDILMGADTAINQIRDSGADAAIYSLETDIISKVNPTTTLIDDADIRKSIVDTVAQFQGDDLNVLNTQLQQIHPQLNISLSPDQFSEIRWQAQKVKTGLENMDELSRLAITETCLPHYNNQLRSLTVPEIDHIQTFAVKPLAERIQQRVEHGESLSTDPQIRQNFDYLLQKLGHARMERERMIENLDKSPQTAQAALDLIRKKGFAMEAAKRLKMESQQEIQRQTEDQRIPTTGREKDIAIEKIKAKYEQDAAKIADTIQSVVNERFQ